MRPTDVRPSPVDVAAELPARPPLRARQIGKAIATRCRPMCETALLIVHSERGAADRRDKGGRIRRDNASRWWSGEQELSSHARVMAPC